MFDVAYYPQEPGPYNFDVEGDPGISAGLSQEGKLNRSCFKVGWNYASTTDKQFEEQNIEFIQLGNGSVL